MAGPVDGATQVAAGYLDVMKREPLSLSLVVMNLALLFVFWFILKTVADNNHVREGQLFEQQKHSAYPGCYALSKVLEEVMLEQYVVQYDLSGCCLRAPWIMEKDDFKYTLSFGEDVFGGPHEGFAVSVAVAAQVGFGERQRRDQRERGLQRRIDRVAGDVIGDGG